MLVLNSQGMEFSTVGLPLGIFTVTCNIVEAGEGRLGAFHIGENSSDCFYSIRQSNYTPNRWLIGNTISLDSRYEHFITGVTERYAILVGKENKSYDSSSLKCPGYECFILDVKTLQIDRMCAKKHTKSGISGTHIYTNYPPSLLSSSKI